MFSSMSSMIKIILFISMFLTGCNLLAKPNISSKKLFELDLTDSGISAEGGGIELNRTGNYCFITLNIYGEIGQEKYNFKFIKNNLISTNYLKYRYENGMIEVDDDLKDLIANDKPNSVKNNMELIINKSFIGSQNKDIVKKFNEYKKKIPQVILNKNCN